MTLPGWIYPLLFVGALLAGWVDSIAGGGGLVTLPLLLWVGIPAPMVLGTNKFQSSFGSFTAAYYYRRRALVSIRDALPGVIFTLIGAAGGTLAVEQISGDMLAGMIPVLLLLIALYMLFTPTVGLKPSHARFSRMAFYVLFGLALGFYDGMFGPGVGSFWAIAFVFGLGFDLTRATGYTKVMNFVSNVVSLLLFLAGGRVLFAVGIIMAVGQAIGARIGSAMVISRGVRFIRPVFMSMVILTTLKLLYNRYF
ncbi:MAG TPA: TSUP family transporter [Bacteroidota bacterium]|nr:TSUP family transporter [Bacteroidota bacterium]